MGFTDETVRFNLDDGSKDEISNTLTNVYRYNDARNQIRKYERDEIVEELVRYYLKGNGIDL